MVTKDTSLDHILSVIRRQVNNEFPDLTVLFIPYQPGQAEQALESQKHALDEYISADTFIQQLTTKNKLPKRGSKLVAFYSAQKKAFPYLRTKKSELALVLVDKKDNEMQRSAIFYNSPERYDWLMGYSLAWQALEASQNYKDPKHSNLYNKIELSPKQTLFIPQYDQMHHLRSSMLAECFAALTLEQQNEKGTIAHLGKKRSEMALTAIPYYTAEAYPFPITQDAVKLIVDDLEPSDLATTTPIQNTLLMTEEIHETFDDIDLKQWLSFAETAQEMAWSDREKKEILSSAAYSSDDAHTRTTAYMIAEKLNTDLIPVNNNELHNPFADQERFQKLHLKTAKRNTEKILDLAIAEHHPEHLLKEAIAQNEKLFKGQIIGWCSPALVKTAYAYSKEDIRPELLRDIFENMIGDVKWEHICHLNQFIMKKNREKSPITPKIIIDEFVRDDPDLAIFKDAFLSQ